MDALAWKTVTVVGREGCIGTKSRNCSTDKSIPFELGLKCQPCEANFKSCKNPKFCPPIPPLFSPPLLFSDPLKFIWINKPSEEDVEGGSKPELNTDENRDGLINSECRVVKTSQQMDESNAEEGEESAGMNGRLGPDDSQTKLADQSPRKLKESHDNSGAQASQGKCFSSNDENEPQNPNDSDETSHANWVGRIMELGSSWKEEKKCVPNSSSNAASSSKNEPCLSQEIDYGCNCRPDGDPNHPVYSCKGHEDFLCYLRKQVSINEVTHNRDSFSRLLHPVSLPDTKLYAQMSFLCDQAYSIPRIKRAELWKFYRLRYVTSSLDKTAKTTAKVASSMSATNNDLQSLLISSETRGEGNFRGNDGTNSKPSVSPRVAYEIAASAASYIHSQTKFILPFKSQERNEIDNNGNLSTGTKQDGITDTDNNKMNNETDKDAEDTALVKRRPYRDTRQTFTNSQQAEPGKLSSMSKPKMAAIVVTSSVTTLAASEEDIKQVAVTDLQSLDPPPCEWFICDDDRKHTRYFVIQGSNSLASWQANLFFEPKQFEGFEVLVHRGIYEAAKGMYERILPKILSHLRRHGEDAKFRFIGHSLGGSLSLLLNLMLLIRGVALKTSLLPVITFGSPCVMCGGDFLLQKLGLPNNHVRAVMIHRDIVPRSFACNYPDHVAEVLKRVNISFRDHPCLNLQKILYGPTGQLLILQPDKKISPPHPLLPSGCGFYVLHHIKQDNNKHENDLSRTLQVQAAQTNFLNTPHPLEILSDRFAYGPEGSISRDHDSSNYLKVINYILRQQLRKSRREQRRQVWRPPVTEDSPRSSKRPSKAAEESKMSEDLTSICK